MNDLVLSPDGSLLLWVCKAEYGIVRTDNDEVVFRCGDPEASYSDPFWSLNGDKLVVCYRHASSVAVLDRLGQLKCSIPYDGVPEDVELSPTNSLLAVIGDTHLQISDSENGREVFRQSLSKPGIDVAFSHDGARLAYGGEFGAISIVDISQMRTLCNLPSLSNVECIAFSPDDTLLATGHADSIIRIWDLATGSLRSELPGHDRFVFDLDFSADGRTLVSTSRDGTIRLWSVVHNRSYGVLCRCFGPELNEVNCQLSLSPDGRVLAVGYRTEVNGVPNVLLWKIGEAGSQ
jgi:WD40 repeat protein